MATRVSVRTALTALLLVQTTVVGLTVGALSLRQGHQAVDELAAELATEVGHRVDGRIADLLAGPPLLNELNSDAITAAHLDLYGPTEPLEALFFRHIRRVPVSLTYVGTERGDYIGARRIADGEYTISLVNAQTTFKNERYATSIDGERTELLLRSDSVYDPRKRPWYVAAAATETPAWTDVYTDYTSGALGITASRAVRSPSGELLGVLATDLLLDDLDAFLQRLDVGENGIVYITDHDGLLVSSSTEAPLFTGPRGEQERVSAAHSDHHTIAGAAAALAMAHPETVVIDVDGDATIVQVARYLDPMGLDWQIVVAVPRSDFTAHIDANVRYTLVICLLAMALAMLIGVVATRRLTSALTAVSDEMGAVGRLDIEARALARSSLVEVDVMHDSLARMKGGLRSFGRYVPVELVRQLLTERSEAVLGAESRELTIVFSDIADFTPMVERNEDDVVVRELGAYLDGMNDAVDRHDGTICQYLGDGIMVLWGAPTPQEDHAIRAVRGALAMAALSRERVARAMEEGRPILKTRIGVNTGESIVGNIGAPERFNYAALGDPVNTASRIEGLNKVYGTEVLIGERTRELLGRTFELRLVDRVRVKGKQELINVYEPLGERGMVDASELDAARAYEAAFSAYQARDFGQARTLFSALSDPASALLAARCSALEAAPPPADWNGGHALSEK